MKSLYQYLASNGRDLPPMHAHHKLGGEFEEYCVFCEDQKHERYAVAVFEAPIVLYGVNSGTYACLKCTEQIAEMTSKFRSWEPFTDPSIKEIHVRRDLISQSTPKFDFTVFLHFDYIKLAMPRSYSDHKVKFVSELCYMCKESTTSNSYDLIQVPRIPHSVLQTGGNIRICADCMDSIELSYALTPKYAQCCDCGASYSTSDKELEEMVSLTSHSRDGFKCPVCVNKTYIENAPNHLGSGLQVLKPEIICEYCKTEFRLDLRQSNRNIRKIWPVAGKPACYFCLRNMEHPIQSHINHDFVLQVYMDDSTRTVRVGHRRPKKMLMDITTHTPSEYLENLETALKTYFNNGPTPV